MSKFHFILGMLSNLFNPRVSLFSFLSSKNNIDKTVCIYRGVKVKGSEIGAYTYIGNNTDIENAIIGRFCSIADHCRIGMGDHSINYLSSSPIFTERVNGCKVKWIDKDVSIVRNEPVRLGNDVWVGSHVLIKGGIKIGDGAVIGAGAVVVKDVPPYAIVGGVPAKVIRYRFPNNLILMLQKCKWWDLPYEVLKQNLKLFQTDCIDAELCERLCHLNDYRSEVSTQESIHM